MRVGQTLTEGLTNFCLMSLESLAMFLTKKLQIYISLDLDLGFLFELLLYIQRYVWSKTTANIQVKVGFEEFQV